MIEWKDLKINPEFIYIYFGFNSTIFKNVCIHMSSSVWINDAETQQLFFMLTLNTI